MRSVFSKYQSFAGFRRLEDLAHFQKQTLELARREIVDPLSWIDARLKQDIDQYRGI